MSSSISKDQAVTAIILWEMFLECAERNADAETFLMDFTQSNARYAMVEMAKDADMVFDLIPASEQDRLIADDMFHRIMIDMFDYTSGQVPKLARPHQEVADRIVETFGLKQITSAAPRP